MGSEADILDCLIVGGGPAGLTTALYLARFKRQFLVVDSGSPRAAWIPTSHNIPVFAEGISGKDILARARANIGQYGDCILPGTVTGLRRQPDRFIAIVEKEGGGTRQISARRVMLATGAVDIEPDLPDVPNAVQQGLVRYCPICDGYESRDQKIAVIAYGAHGVGEAVFIARTYSDDVTLLTLGQPLELDAAQREKLDQHRIKVVEDPVGSLEIEDNRISAIHFGGQEHRFDVLYSALGLKYRSDLALALGAEHDSNGSLIVDGHCQTTVRGLYAAGDIVRGADQIVIGMGHAALASIHIHNHCELPTEDEAGGA